MQIEAASSSLSLVIHSCCETSSQHTTADLFCYSNNYIAKIGVFRLNSQTGTLTGSIIECEECSLISNFFHLIEEKDKWKKKNGSHIDQCHYPESIGDVGNHLPLSVEWVVGHVMGRETA